MDGNTTKASSMWVSSPTHHQLTLGLQIVYHPTPRYVGRIVEVTPGQPVIIGRDGDAFGRGALRDNRMSRKHVQITRSGEQLAVEDLDSRNGLWVAMQRVPSAHLLEGDLFAAGSLLFLVTRVVSDADTDWGVLVGASSPMVEVLALLDLAARRPTTTLLLGETGVGKELLAQEIHRRSGRTGAFVPINCGALSPTLMHSELFGHARGAFSGAASARQGLVEEARGGTLFLDEIGEASPELQVLLLRLLQEKEIRPVGTNKPLTVDVRFVAATNRDLRAEAEAGSFRKDLLARLYRWLIEIPPLRDRRADIPLLIRHMVRRFADEEPLISGSLTWRLMAHSWPGNVRELEAIVERLVVSAGSTNELIEPSWLHAALAQPEPPQQAPEPPQQVAQTTPPPASRSSRPDAQSLLQQLSDLGGNVRALSQELGVSRNTLYRWFREDGISPSKSRKE